MFLKAYLNIGCNTSIFAAVVDAGNYAPGRRDMIIHHGQGPKYSYALKLIWTWKRRCGAREY
jgi:hypothetical protein